MLKGSRWTKDEMSIVQQEAYSVFLRGKSYYAAMHDAGEHLGRHRTLEAIRKQIRTRVEVLKAQPKLRTRAVTRRDVLRVPVDWDAWYEATGFDPRIDGAI